MKAAMEKAKQLEVLSLPPSLYVHVAQSVFAQEAHKRQVEAEAKAKADAEAKKREEDAKRMIEDARRIKEQEDAQKVPPSRKLDQPV